MRNILERLAAGEILFCDGAMGTMLSAKGMQPGECPELWCVQRPDDVRDIHRQYREAGSDIVETNSFGGTAYKLRAFGLAERATELNTAAAGLAREVAGETQHVLGSMGPTGEFLEPLGDATEAEFYGAYKQQAEALAAGGADLLIVETMTALDEAQVAIRAARENTDCVVLASFTFDPGPNDSYATMMGVRPPRAAEGALAAGAHIIGANCGVGPEHMVKVLAALHTACPDVPLMAMANAGMPQVVNGETVYAMTPEKMAALAPAMVEAGAVIIGGCCGTTPAHIAAIKAAVLGA